VSKIGISTSDAFAGVGITFGTYSIPATGGVMD
jgi:hypothetical protein